MEWHMSSGYDWVTYDVCILPILPHFQKVLETCVMIRSLDTQLVAGFQEHRVSRTLRNGRLRISSCFQMKEEMNTGHPFQSLPLKALWGKTLSELILPWWLLRAQCWGPSIQLWSWTSKLNLFWDYSIAGCQAAGMGRASAAGRKDLPGYRKGRLPMQIKWATTRTKAEGRIMAGTRWSMVVSGSYGLWMFAPPNSYARILPPAWWYLETGLLKNGKVQMVL